MTLSQNLSLLTYGNSIVMPKDNPNIFMGIGLWSVKNGLSEGLPIDVMHMLLSATVMRAKIMEENPGKSSKVILLIADSMAIREGADKNKVSQLVQIYKKSLEPLLDLLKIKDSYEIILSSDLENRIQYKKTLESIKNSPIVKQLKIDDPIHYKYIRTQTTITHYMNQYENVGIKLGWLCAESSQQLKGQVSAQSLKHWDELKFDRWYQEICKNSTLECLYTKPGLKQPSQGKQVSVIEGCPYTAYPQDKYYTIQTQQEKDIKTICPLQKRVCTQWIDVALVCSNLMQKGLVKSNLLPADCIKERNQVATVYNMLKYWTNYPAPKKI
jgi:hypothetical protein